MVQKGWPGTIESGGKSWSVQVGHFHVQEHEGDSLQLVLVDVQRIGTSAGLPYGKTVLLQSPGQHVAQGRLIIHDQDSGPLFPSHVLAPFCAQSLRRPGISYQEECTKSFQARADFEFFGSFRSRNA
jgi:hypothetical protein